MKKPGGARWLLPAAITGAAALAGIAGYVALRAARPPGEADIRTSLRISDVLGTGPGEGFARALEPRPFVFPADHGPHPSFRSEWWYLTGNLQGAGGEPFGFQVTFFRAALAPGPASGPSAWATHQVYMGHFALTDGEGRTFRAYERFDRGALGLAGARAEPFRVWLEDWVLEGPGGRGLTAREEGRVAGLDAIFPLRLDAAEGDRAVSLLLRPGKPLVLQGDQGLSRKGPQAGNASFYYSFTRLVAEGTVTSGGEEVPVQGLAWLDREWSTSALSRDQVGWDWFALHLSDGMDLMYYQLRSSDGGPDPYSAGVLVGPDGGTRSLGPEEVKLTVLDRWASPRGGVTYPARWRLVVPGEELDLEIVPLLADQELNLTFRYWEGAVKVDGTVGSSPVHGRGYVELTGYADLPSSGKKSFSNGSGSRWIR